MRFTIQPEIFEAFPGLRVVAVVATGLDNAVDRPDVTRVLADAWSRGAEGEHREARSHPRIQPWRDRFRTMGVSPRDFPSSIEALLRRALKGKEPPRINPLVDLYNALSLRHVVPMGGFDIGAIRQGLDLRFTRAGDTFHGLDADAPEPLASGEVAYADGPTVLTRHFVWRQARTALIQRETADVLLMSEILGDLEATLAEAVEEDLRDELERHFRPERSHSAILDEERSTLEW